MDNSLDTTKENKRLLDQEGSGFLPMIVNQNANTIISQESDVESEDDDQDFEEFVRNKQNGFKTSKPKILQNQQTLPAQVEESIEEELDKNEPSVKSQRAAYKSVITLVKDEDKVLTQKTSSKQKERMYQQDPVDMKIPDYKDEDVMSDPMGPQTSKRDSVSMKSKKGTVKNNQVHLSQVKPVLPTPTKKTGPKIITPASRTVEKQQTQYRSRNDNKFEDDQSMYQASDVEEDDGFAKTSMPYLKKNHAILKKELDRNIAMMEVEAQKQALGANSDQDVKPNKRFKNFNDLFSGLTKSQNVPTLYPIINCCITYNSKSAITVTMQDERTYWVKQYNLETYATTFEEKIGGLEDSYIKLKEVEQNPAGNKFAITYIDDGIFKMRTFGETNRSPQEIAADEVNINDELGLNNYTMPINNFPDPFISCHFINNSLIFVNLFHNATLTHYHFFWNTETRKRSQNAKIVLDCNNKNFPQKCFYSSDNNEIYTFYRQGQSMRIPVLDIESSKNEGKEEYYLQKIYDKDLGAMFLVYEEALVVRSSSQVLFFKVIYDPLIDEKKWVLYHQIDFGGFIYYIRGNIRIQITTDTQIYFYIIDRETLMPKLENVMNNFMNCSQMMFGSKVKYGITYKTNEKSFDIHRRKFEHDFKANVVAADMDGSRGLPIESMNAFLVSRIDTIKFYDIDTFEELKESQIQVPLFKDDERERKEIISMQMSSTEQMLAVISGKNLIMNEQKPNQLFIFKRARDPDPLKIDKFNLIKRIIIKDIPIFTKVSMQFYFKNSKSPGKDPNEIIFAKQDRLFSINIETEEITTIVKYVEPLTRQPEFFTMNDDQTASVIASLTDGIFYNHRTEEFVDLDDLYQISSIKEIIYDSDDRMVYILANKYQDKLGVFIVRFSELDPNNFNFFLKFKNKLDIADADIAVLRCNETKLKELIVSYKTIHSNIYTVQVVDISRKNPWPIYLHQSFQLWESQITAFFIEKNQEYVMINRDGISVMGLGSGTKRSIKDSSGQEKMIHPLESANYLKVDRDNFIQFEFAGQKKVINIIQQFSKHNSKTGEETAYDDIYKVRINDITLRELLLFQSLYVCSTQSDILKLVKSQANPSVFYKSFLELDGTNMASILSFDSRSMKYILDDQFSEFFQSDFPMFYKNKIAKSNNKDRFFYRSAIDNALKNNQISAIQIIIEYIIKYQNSFVSSFLFKGNFTALVEKGVRMTGLLESEVFYFQFDFDEWPSTHTDDETYYRPYNGNIFDIRTQYRTVFHEENFEEMNDDLVQDTSRVFKIKYTINTLSQLGEYVHTDANGDRTLMNEEESIICLLAESDELSLFETENLEQLITFKWQAFAKKFHTVGCIAHFSYLLIMMIYVNAIYVNNDKSNAYLYGILLFVGIAYPMCYDLYQLQKTGFKEYFSDPQNYSDQLYVWCSIINVISQNSTDSQAFHNKVLMTIIFLQQIIKSFFYLRIFQSLSYIVTMIYTVVADLKVFLLFFTILVVLFAQIMAVIGVGNYNFDNGLKEYVDMMEAGEVEENDIPMEEYEQIGLWLGTMVSTLRIAMGDFDFDASKYLTPQENALFWIIWLMVVVMTCIIFLNFIIAEASASYEKVKENLQSMINIEKSQLIGEAEGMIFQRTKTDQAFPKYIIVREVEI